MKYNNLKTYVILLLLSASLTGCSLLIKEPQITIIDTVYTPKQCPTFDHHIELKVKKFSSDVLMEDGVVADTKELVESLSKNTAAREFFNASVINGNKEHTILGTTDLPEKDVSRVTKKIYVDRVCPNYTFTPEFKIKKITEDFHPALDGSYSMMPLSDIVYALEQHKTIKQKFNDEVDKLNSISWGDVALKRLKELTSFEKSPK